MTDYSKLSGFDIDKAVADALGLEYEIGVMFVTPVDKVNGKHTEEYILQKITSNEKHWKRFSPVNIPNNAWPIITENKINIAFDCNENEWVAWGNFEFDHCGWDMIHEPGIHYSHSNPLRAAMIVFLQMQEDKQ